MASMVYRRSKIATKLLYKVRHHKGHGVHSPFVFNLINNVIEEKRPYYSYQDLKNFLEQFPEKRLTLKKDNLLSFRLVNYFNARAILEIGVNNGVNTLCLTAPSSQIECLAIEENENKHDNIRTLYSKYPRGLILENNLEAIPNQLFDCIYINLNYSSINEQGISALINLCHDKSFIIVKGIRTNRKQNKLWKCLTANERRTAELDLFNIGILFFDKQLYRWKYQISF